MDLEMIDEAASEYIEAILPIVRASFRAGVKSGVKYAEAESEEICKQCVAEAAKDVAEAKRKEAADEVREREARIKEVWDRVIRKSEVRERELREKDRQEFIDTCRRVIRGCSS